MKKENRPKTFYRLPTEAEWELAARAGGPDTPADLNQVAWYDANGGNETHDVATKSPNAFGLFDMLGNVWEWSEDFYDADAYRFVPDVDPTGPKITRCQYRVMRGGSFLSDAKSCTPAHRDLYQDSRMTKAIGFR